MGLWTPAEAEPYIGSQKESRTKKYHIKPWAGTTTPEGRADQSPSADSRICPRSIKPFFRHPSSETDVLASGSPIINGDVVSHVDLCSGRVAFVGYHGDVLYRVSAGGNWV